MTTIEELKRREKRLSMLLRFFVALLLLIGLFLIGFMISFLGHDNVSIAEPARQSSSLLFFFTCGHFMA